MGRLRRDQVRELRAAVALYTRTATEYPNAMVLPPGPLRLKRSFVWKYQLGGVVLVLAGVASAVGYAWWQYDEVKELIGQSRIWPVGVAALRTEVSGKVSTHKFIFHEYELDVKYVDAGLKAHASKLSFNTLGCEIDKDAEPEVRYLKDSPGQFALSWAMQVSTSRWLSIAFMGIAGVGLIGGSFSYLGYLALRRLAHTRSCARRSDELLVRVTKVEPQMVKGSHTGNEYHFEGQTVDGRPVQGKIAFSVKEEPLFADPEKRTMLAMVPPENLKRAVVPRSDFHPFDLTETQQVEARASLARLHPAR